MRNIIEHNDELHERTNTLLYKNISLTLYSWKGDVGCVWEVSWRQEQTTILPNSTSFSSWLGCSTMGHWGPRALCLPLVLNSASCIQLTCFSKYPNSQPIASSHDIIHTPVSFPILGLLWQSQLSYPLHTCVNCTQCLCTWTKSWIVQSPTKLNDKI